MANPFFDNPKTRRLKKDLAEMKALAEQSDILEFKAEGDAPSTYKITFHGKGLVSESETGDKHNLSINLGAEYPRSMPSVHWDSPILHPNIRGTPCFGTFMMNPNVKLTEVVEILWDMARMAVYNPYGGYSPNDLWQVLRKKWSFPLDQRILRNKAPVVEAPPKAAEGEEDLFIMSGHSMGGLPPSQIWVKTALEQYFESRGMAEHAEVLSADDVFRETQEILPGLVGMVQMEPDLVSAMESSSDAQWFSEDFNTFLRRLGIHPQEGLRPGEVFLFQKGS